MLMLCRSERTRAVTSVFGSLDVGSVVGLLVSGPLIRSFGWPSVFYFFAFLGLLWSALWPTLKPGDLDPSQIVAPRPSPNADSKSFWPQPTFAPRALRMYSYHKGAVYGVFIEKDSMFHEAADCSEKWIVHGSFWSCFFQHTNGQLSSCQAFSHLSSFSERQ